MGSDGLRGHVHAVTVAVGQDSNKVHPQRSIQCQHRCTVVPRSL